MKKITENGCERVQDLLSAYVDGELNKQQCRSVEKHLLDCKECREHVTRMRALSQMLRESAVQATPSVQLSATVMNAVHGMPRDTRMARIRTMRRIAGALTCVGCFLIIGVAVWLGGGRIAEGLDGSMSFDAPMDAESPLYSQDQSPEASQDEKGDFSDSLMDIISGLDWPTKPELPDSSAGGTLAPDEPVAPEEPSVPEAPMEPVGVYSYTLKRITSTTVEQEDVWMQLDGAWECNGISAAFDAQTKQAELIFADGEVWKGELSVEPKQTLVITTEKGNVYTMAYKIGGDALWLEIRR